MQHSTVVTNASFTKEDFHGARTYRGVTLTVTSVIQQGVTVETINFAFNGKPFEFTGAYGNAQRAAERAIHRELGLTLCPNCEDPTCPELPICSACYARGYGNSEFGGEVPAGVDW